MIRPMTATQKAALDFIAGQPRGETCGYTLKVNRCGTTATLRQLAARGYVGPIGLGHSAFPANGIFRITKAGREALSQ